MADDQAVEHAKKVQKVNQYSEVFEAMEPGEPYGAPGLADELGENRRTVFYHLEKLEEVGVVSRAKLGHRTTVWTRTAEADPRDQEGATQEA